MQRWRICNHSWRGAGDCLACRSSDCPVHRSCRSDRCSGHNNRECGGRAQCRCAMGNGANCWNQSCNTDSQSIRGGSGVVEIAVIGSTDDIASITNTECWDGAGEGSYCANLNSRCWSTCCDTSSSANAPGDVREVGTWCNAENSGDCCGEGESGTLSWCSHFSNHHRWGDLGDSHSGWSGRSDC